MSAQLEEIPWFKILAAVMDKAGVDQIHLSPSDLERIERRASGPGAHVIVVDLGMQAGGGVLVKLLTNDELATLKP